MVKAAWSKVNPIIFLYDGLEFRITSLFHMAKTNLEKLNQFLDSLETNG